MNITESNKLIAEFMNDASWNDADCDGGNCFLPDWNDLMPVVERIEGLGFKTSIENRHCSIDGDEVWFETTEFNTTKISAVYQAAVAFIKWHNENKKQ